jgi:molybdate transport system ATP-binding protein
LLPETDRWHQPESNVHYSHHPPRLAVRLRHNGGSFSIDVDFHISAPWTVLFGPSGSGKTTILRAIAGLLRPQVANITYSANPLPVVYADSASGVWVPSHQRGMCMAPQAATLFPHLNVTQNLVYGAGLVRNSSEAKQRDEYVASMLARFRITHLADKMPNALSGGEAQRVNMARAVTAMSKRWLLLDEAFTGLDVSLRDELIAELLSWQSEFKTPVLSVTHDVAEAFQLGAEVIKIADGRVVAQGPVEVVLAEERKRLLAQLGSSPGLTPRIQLT